MARLVIIGDLEVIMSKENGNIDTETIRNSIVFECDSAEELTQLVRNAGSLSVRFTSQELPNEQPKLIE